MRNLSAAVLISILVIGFLSSVPFGSAEENAPLKPGSLSVKVTDWGNTEYDVTLNLGGTYDWVVKVKLKDSSSVSSFWSANKAEEGGYIVFTPVSWNKGPTATFGFIATGSEPVEAIYLYVNGQLWDIWPANAQQPAENQTGTNPSPGNGTPSSNQTSPNPAPGNETSPSPENGTGKNPTPGNETGANPSNETTPSAGNLVRPGSFSVKIQDWGNTEYDVTLNLGGTYYWKVNVKLKEGSTVSSAWSVNKAEENGYVVLTPLSWNLGPTATFGFTATGSKPVEAMYLYVNDQLWDVWPENAPIPGNETSPENQTGTNPTSGNETSSLPSGAFTNTSNPGEIGGFYKVVSADGSTEIVEITLANNNTRYVWNGYCFDVKNVTFRTTGRVVSVKYADGGSPKYSQNGDLVTLDLTWRGIFHLNTTVKILVEIQKAGNEPTPHDFKVNYVRGPVVYPDTGSLPANWRPGNFTLSDLIADPASYYSTSVKPHTNGFIMYDPPSTTQIIIGLADITYPLNLAKSSRMWVPNKYFAMGIALTYELFKINPNFLMALGAKENWGTAVTKDPAFTGYTVTIDGEEYHWPIVIGHPDGVFQVEKGNFNQIKAYYPDLFPDTADHDDYMKVSLDPKDTAWITSPVVAGISLTMERELLYAAVGEKYNEFLRQAKDPWAEAEIIDYGYNRGMGSLASFKIFSDNWEKAINAKVLWQEFNMAGFGGHVPTVINITATMDMETERIYDANITWEDLQYFFSVVREKFFRPGAMSDAEWNAMMEDVHRAYKLLAHHWGGDHISYRYDFLTILRVAMSHWPEPHVPRPTGDDWYYQARNYSP
ncbi:MAG: hypothetical protein PWQ79_1990 [Thermococcaceae archaeon]|nr:hypothetical protein [Thermococcaceae archaeon]MDK2915075.1 hypothetical protein [Thermococcaceae archaeon]